MKITKNYLRQLILEELDNMNELVGLAPGQRVLQRLTRTGTESQFGGPAELERRGESEDVVNLGPVHVGAATLESIGAQLNRVLCILESAFQKEEGGCG